MRNKKIEQIIAENYAHAFVLYTAGIAFYTCEQHTLTEVCQKKSIDIKYVLQLLEEPLPFLDFDSRQFKNMSTESLVGFLKHQHILFLQKKIPYIAHLIEHLPNPRPHQKSLVTDLQLMFPLFAEDFIHHIHEEEDHFFYYILSLQKLLKTEQNKAKSSPFLKEYSIQDFALAHDNHDNEMQGIRELTSNYSLPDNETLHIKVIYKNLEELEHQLAKHAYIENEILFPKALVLETQIRRLWKEASKWN